MKRFGIQALSAGAIAFSAVTLLYKDAQYAAVGPVSIATDTLLKVIPGAAALLWPILSAKWPAITSAVKLVWSMFQLGDAETAKVLSHLSAVEAFAAARPEFESVGTNAKASREKILKGIR